MLKGKKPELGEDFLWGVSVSAYQVEGGNHNQWSEWEEEHAHILAAKAEKQYGWLPNWTDIKKQAQDPSNYINDRGVDHYRRYGQDFDIARKLNFNAFRFGVEWSRIEPEEGQFNQAAIDHYKDYIHGLKKRGLQPVITLWHWTAPVWFERKGGFTKRRNIDYFVRFVDRIAEELVEPSGWVLTINEPNSYVGMSFMEGQWPPGKRSPVLAIRVFYNLAVAHRRVYRLLKDRYPHLNISVAHQCNNNRPKRPHSPGDRLIAALANYSWNWWYLNRIKRHMDFIGFNYYFTDYWLASRNPVRRKKGEPTDRGPEKWHQHNPAGPLNDLGWYMEPKGLYRVIMEVSRRYKLPIIITETGVADTNDQYRKWWLEETLAALTKANSRGANVIGYFHWSLLDNFEWSQGWWPKFGLVKVDREHGLVRTIRPSARWLAEHIKKNS